MDKFISAIFFALLGAAAVKFLPRFLKQQRTKNNNSNNDNMSKNDFYQPYERSERQVSCSSRVDESRPSTVAIIYRSEMDYISRCILDYPNIETGGQLFGFWTTEGIPVILYAIGPGPNSEHHPVHFIQDANYLKRVGEILIGKYGLQHIGEWHSHHQLGLAKPSGQDANNMVDIINTYNLRHYLLCIGNCTQRESVLNAFSFHENSPSNYVHAQWEIKAIDSPFRNLIDEELSNILIHPQTEFATIGTLYTVERTNTRYVIPDYSSEYWLNSKNNNRILKAIIDYLGSSENANVKVQMDNNRIVHLFVIKRGIIEHIIFSNHFPYEAPSIEIIADEEKYIKNKEGDKVQWLFNGDIYNSFINYYNSLNYDNK